MRPKLDSPLIVSDELPESRKVVMDAWRDWPLKNQFPTGTYKTLCQLNDVDRKIFDQAVELRPRNVKGRIVGHAGCNPSCRVCARVMETKQRAVSNVRKPPSASQRSEPALGAPLKSYTNNDNPGLENKLSIFINTIPRNHVLRYPTPVVVDSGHLHFDAEIFAGPALVLRTRTPSACTSSLNADTTSSSPDARQ